MATTYPNGTVRRVGDDLVLIDSSLGTDFIRVCPTHYWASGEYVRQSDLPACPHCAIQADTLGHDRFAALQLRLMPDPEDLCPSIPRT